MRRIIVLLMAGAMIALVIGAGTTPAVAKKPEDKGAKVTPNTCFEQGGGTTCFHTVSTPGDTFNSQLRSRDVVNPADDGAVVGHQNIQPLHTNTDIITPSGNTNTSTHDKAAEQ